MSNVMQCWCDNRESTKCNVDFGSCRAIKVWARLQEVSGNLAAREFRHQETIPHLAVPNSLRIFFHKKGWMDESGGKEWICQCLPRTCNNKQSLLVWDLFQAHLTYEVKAAQKQQKIDVAVIPGGLTPVLQPLDKCLIKPFKDSIRKKYLAWMISGPFEYTPSRKKKALTRNLVLRWVNSIKVHWPKVLFVALVYCVLLLRTSLQADFRICVTFPLVLTSEKKMDQNSRL